MLASSLGNCGSGAARKIGFGGLQPLCCEIEGEGWEDEAAELSEGSQLWELVWILVGTT